LKPEDLQWRSAPMPGASGPVEIAALPSLRDGAWRAYVRFPPGWSRPGPGHYAVAEEVRVLKGDLHMNGQSWGPGDWLSIPAGRTRLNTYTTQGCLALAWFAGEPRWIQNGNT
jgi:hypothetical protein